MSMTMKERIESRIDYLQKRQREDERWIGTDAYYQIRVDARRDELSFLHYLVDLPQPGKIIIDIDDIRNDHWDKINQQLQQYVSDFPESNLQVGPALQFIRQWSGPDSPVMTSPDLKAVSLTLGNDVNGMEMTLDEVVK